MVFLQEEDYFIPYEYQPTHQSGKRMGDLHCWWCEAVNRQPTSPDTD